MDDRSALHSDDGRSGGVSASLGAGERNKHVDDAVWAARMTPPTDGGMVSSEHLALQAVEHMQRFHADFLMRDRRNAERLNNLTGQIEKLVLEWKAQAEHLARAERRTEPQAEIALGREAFHQSIREEVGIWNARQRYILEERNSLQKHCNEQQKRIEALVSSTSWRITSPLRFFVCLFRRRHSISNGVKL